MRLKEAPSWWKYIKRSHYSLNYIVSTIVLGLMLYLYARFGYHIIFILGFLSIAAGTVYFLLESLDGSLTPQD